MHNQKLLLILLLTVAVAVSSDVVDVEAEDVDAAAASTGISTLAPGAQHSRNLVKRAPTSSFIGMRGKKEQEATTDDHWSGPDPVEYAEDDADDYYNENGRRLKKAPMSFVGMRGKKYSHGNSNLRSLLEEMEEDRVRDNVLREIFNQIVGDDNEVGKRAPTGFTGMRGKRPASEDEEDALELMQKRALANSFVGVRGKKDVSHQNYKRAALSEVSKIPAARDEYVTLRSNKNIITKRC